MIIARDRDPLLTVLGHELGHLFNLHLHRFVCQARHHRATFEIWWFGQHQQAVGVHAYLQVVAACRRRT